MENKNYIIGYIISSNYRRNTMECLEKHPQMPRDISKKTGILTNHISNILRQLKEHNLVECINPEVKKGRLYRLTDDGIAILKEIEEKEL